MSRKLLRLCLQGHNSRVRISGRFPSMVRPSVIPNFKVPICVAHCLSGHSCRVSLEGADLTNARLYAADPERVRLRVPFLTTPDCRALPFRTLMPKERPLGEQDCKAFSSPRGRTFLYLIFSKASFGMRALRTAVTPRLLSLTSIQLLETTQTF